MAFYALTMLNIALELAQRPDGGLNTAYEDMASKSFDISCRSRTRSTRSAARVCGISRRMTCLFEPDEDGRRPCHGGDERYATDPAWRDLILFHEFFHADTGRGCGASHQTGWTALVARLIRTR